MLNISSCKICTVVHILQAFKIMYSCFLIRSVVSVTSYLCLRRSWDRKKNPQTTVSHGIWL